MWCLFVINRYCMKNILLCYTVLYCKLTITSTTGYNERGWSLEYHFFFMPPLFRDHNFVKVSNQLALLRSLHDKVIKYITVSLHIFQRSYHFLNCGHQVALRIKSDSFLRMMLV